MVITEREVFDIRRYLDSQEPYPTCGVAICGMQAVGKKMFLERYRSCHVDIPADEAALPRATAVVRPRQWRPRSAREWLYGGRQMNVLWDLHDWGNGDFLFMEEVVDPWLASIENGADAVKRFFGSSSRGNGGSAAVHGSRRLGVKESSSAGMGNSVEPAEYTPATDGYLLCYDVGDRVSFEALRPMKDSIVARVVMAREEARLAEDEETSKTEAEKKADAEARGLDEGSREMRDMLTRRELRREKGAERPMVVIGCKSDRPREVWEVSQAEGEAFARDIGASFVLSSAKSGEGIDEAVAEILGSILLARLALEGARLDEPCLPRNYLD